LRLLQRLFAALETRGHKVAATTEGKTIVTVLDEPLEVSLREPSSTPQETEVSERSRGKA
jgi:hypothetical protein